MDADSNDLYKASTREKINVMQAFADGCAVQYSDDDKNWKTTAGPVWSFGKHYYRVKPRPRKIYCVEHLGQIIRIFFNSDEEALKYISEQKKPENYGFVLFVEEPI